MTQVLDWDVDGDAENIRPGAVELQSALHARTYSGLFNTVESARNWLNSGRTSWRVRTLGKFELFQGSPIHGRVLEIGAGVGWCSGLVSTFRGVEKVFALEYDPYCVRQLMPKVHHVLQADTTKINYVLGSFNHMPVQEDFDLIISMGALHHSENLSKTLAECFKVLKPGGFLVASEPNELNSLTQRQEWEKENRIDPNSETKYGKKTLHKDNSDHYYRLCQYEAAAYFAGFDVFPYVFDHQYGALASDRIFTSKACYNGYRLLVHQPYFAQNTLYDSLMLILRKPEEQLN